MRVARRRRRQGIRTIFQAAWVSGLAATTGLTGCRSGSDSAASSPDVGAEATTSAASPTPGNRTDVVLNAIDDPDRSCVLGFEGTVLDFGDPDLFPRFGSRLQAPPVEVIEREGATWARIRTKTLSVSFFEGSNGRRSETRSGAPLPFFFEAHARGDSAKAMSVYLDGRLVGTVPLTKEARVVSLKSPVAEPAAGANELVLHFSGSPKASTDPVAEVDWIHFGQGEPSAHYAVPTRSEAKASVTLSGTAQRAYGLRAGSYIRCPAFFPKESVVETTLGLNEPSTADAEVRLLRDRAPPLVLGSVHLEPADAQGKPLRFSLPLGEGGAMGAIELAAVRATGASRVLFGEPKVVVESPREAPRPAPVKGVVVVVLGQIATRGLALYGGPSATPEVARLASEGLVFEAHRATSTLENAAFATLLTGLLPRDMALEDADARLPASLTTIADAAKQSGIGTALFTGNPMTGAAFGFDRGWNTFEYTSPADANPAEPPLDRAGRWITQHKGERFLVVVHARGGHPPWDLSQDEQRTIEQEGAPGGIDAKHAGEQLGRLRSLTDADRAKAWAMYELALRAHDAAVGRLWAAIESSGMSRDTALVVTGDVGVAEAPAVPFVRCGSSLEEPCLWNPLVLRAPGVPSGRVAAPTSGQDLGRTVLGLLGLSAPQAFGGVDLVDVALRRAPGFPRPLLATASEHFSLRWGNLTELGNKDREGRLCDLSLEPGCFSDVRGTSPLASTLLHAKAFDLLVTHKGQPPQREPATLEKETRDALHVWGR